MYVKQTVFYFLVIYTINTSAENAANDLDLARVFRTPKDFSRVNFDHFEILERNNFDPTPATQQEPETVNDDVPPSPPVPDQQHPKSVANAQVMLRFGGDDIHGKNCIQTPSKPCPSSIRPYPPQNHLPQMNEMIRYHSPYCLPSYHTLPYFPPPPSSYGYPYTPYAFPGPYYPRPEYVRGPCGVYQGRICPRDDSSLCSQERNFLEGNGASGSTSASHPKVIMTTDLSDDVIPECQKYLGSPIKSPIEMSRSPHHHHQNRPSEYYNPNTFGTSIFPEFAKEGNIMKSDSSHSNPILYPNITDSSEKFPDFIKKTDVLEPEWSQIEFTEPPKENSYQKPLASYTTENNYGQSSDSIKKVDKIGPEQSEVVDIKPKDDNSYYNQPPYIIDPQNSYTNEDRPVKFPDFIKKDDLSEPEWSIDIPEKPSNGKCNHQHQHRPCNPESFPNKNDHGKFSDFINKKNLVEPEWSKDIHVKPSQGKCDHRQPHHSCDPSESYSNDNESRKFTYFIKKDHLVEPEWSGDIHVEPSNGKCNHQHPHRPCNYPESHSNENDHGKFPDFINNEDFVEPEWSKDIHVKPPNPNGKCNHQYPHRPCNHPEIHPNENDRGKFPDFIKQEDLIEPEWSGDIHVKPSNPNGECNQQHPHRLCNHPEIHPNENDHGKFPDFIKKEDLIEPEWSGDIHVKPPNPNGKCNHQLPHRPCNRPEIHPNEKDHGKFPDFIKKEDLVEPKWPGDHMKPSNPNGECDHQHPQRPCNHPEIHPNDNDHGKFPDFIKKEDLIEPEWSGDIHVKPPNPNGKCNHQYPHRPCNHPEIHPNENDHGEFPDFIKKEDLVEPKWSEHIHIKPPNPNHECNHQHPHPSCNYPKMHPNENDHGNFPDFIKKKNLVEPEWSGDIHVKFPQDTYNNQHLHHPINSSKSYPNMNDHGKLVDFVNKEDLVEPNCSEDIHLKSSRGECNHQHLRGSCNTPVRYPNRKDYGRFQDFSRKEDLVKTDRFTDFTKNEDLVESEKSTDFIDKEDLVKPGKFPDFIEKEDLSEPKKFPDFIRKEDLSEPGKFTDPTKKEDLIKPGEFGDFNKKEKLPEPEWPEVVNIPPKGDNSYYNQPPYTIDHQNSRTNEDHPEKFPDFIKEKDLIKNDWSDISNVKSPIYESFHQDSMNSPAKNPSDPEIGKFSDFLNKQDLIEPDGPEVLNSGSLTDDSQMINDSEHPLSQEPASTVIEGNYSTPVNGKPNSGASKSPEYAQSVSKKDDNKLTYPPKVQQTPHMYLLPVDKPLKKYIQIKPMVIYVNQKPGPGIYTDIQGAKRDPNINEIEGWLNKSLVPYVCKACGHKPQLLVTYPLKNDRSKFEEDINISGCQCCRQKGFCDCCNCHRNPSIPFGHRFPSDVDSLLQVTKPPVHDEGTLARIYYGGKRPGEYSTGYSSSSASSLSSSVSQVGDQRPKVYLSGYHSSEGSGYYSDPTRDVVYQRPKVLDFVRTTSPYVPVIQHTRMEEPEWYSVVPKYDIVPKKITPIDIPDLVATDVFVCKQCNTPHHRGIVCHREYVPRAVIEEEPILKRSLWRDTRSH